MLAFWRRGHFCPSSLQPLWKPEPRPRRLASQGASLAVSAAALPALGPWCPGWLGPSASGLFLCVSIMLASRTSGVSYPACGSPALPTSVPPASPRPYLARVLHTPATPIQVTSPGPSSCPSISTSAPAQPMSPPHLPHDPCPPTQPMLLGLPTGQNREGKGDHGRFRS